MALHASGDAEELRAEAFRHKTWPEKVRRESVRALHQLNAFAVNSLARMTRCQFLFILGHMRSGSSLLCHLLCNSEDVIGFGEAHISYPRRRQLAQLLASVRRHTGKNPLRYRYVLDKVLWSHLAMDDALLADRRTRYLFLVREPVGTIASIVAMRCEFHDESLPQAVEFATTYYTERLAELMKLAKRINDPSRCLLLTHQQLILETPVAFGELEHFLKMRAPLSEQYALMPTTGQARIGDRSPNIRIGRIDRSLPRKDVDLSVEVRKRLHDSYAACINTLCETIATLGCKEQAA